jgi:hypothetical protein
MPLPEPSAKKPKGPVAAGEAGNAANAEANAGEETKKGKPCIIM